MRLWALTLDGKGSLWMGTYGAGLGLLRDGRVTTFSEKDGLFDDTAFQLLEDSEGYFWVSGNRGIYRVKKADLLDFADGLLGKLTTVAFGAAELGRPGGAPPREDCRNVALSTSRRNIALTSHPPATKDVARWSSSAPWRLTVCRNMKPATSATPDA